MTEPERLVYRSNLLGSDKRVTNYGGGNTSSKITGKDNPQAVAGVFAEVLGVEVDARMAELARSRGFEVQIARFEDWDSRGVRFDAVVSGQTWHWIDPVAGAAAPPPTV